MRKVSSTNHTNGSVLKGRGAAPSYFDTKTAKDTKTTKGPMGLRRRAKRDVFVVFVSLVLKRLSLRCRGVSGASLFVGFVDIKTAVGLLRPIPATAPRPSTRRAASGRG